MAPFSSWLKEENVSAPKTPPSKRRKEISTS
jgi:hypothetical protein